MYSVAEQNPSKRAAGSRAAGDAEDRTRNRVLGAVLEHGPVSAADLGEMLNVTPAAVRRHLDALTREGVVEVKRVATSGMGAGRPARRYVLTSRGQSSIGDDYLDIARTALHRLAELAGPGAVEDFAEERFGAMERRYQPIVDAAGDDVAARSRALAEALTNDGFVASAAEVASRAPLPAHMASVQLCQGHCPVQQLAAEFPAFCDTETAVFSRLLGVDVRRLSTLASGGHVCTTHIPTGRGGRLPFSGTSDRHVDQAPDVNEALRNERP
ncbi:winged helix-turn-helix transcriptional regulator [Sinomonas sp. ASV322]|uniref:helix-turn-helix transcriptional regulator n=1 Tax=Sinomonas sp. ASV322 TaxID=3041920 RepID=UPI0027DE7169|nr:winged helix-turn-helix transcriptional regulator [Sinomonas sp. ASV322]MDQ4500975.1 winged helix-turn-helix transcriptional regulator [Sinomonas sp. ASV322]